MNQEFAQADISKALDLSALAKFCEEKGYQLVSTRRGHLAIMPRLGQQQPPRGHNRKEGSA